MPDKSRDVAVLGGTFDPPHEGHIQVIRHLQEKGYKHIVLAVTAANPFKERLPVDFVTRVEMLALVLSHEGIPQARDPFEPGIYISDFPYTYVCDFVENWRHKFKDSRIIWVIGEDLSQEYKKWKNWDSLGLEIEIVPEFKEFRSSRVREGKISAHPALISYIAEKRLY